MRVLTASLLGVVVMTVALREARAVTYSVTDLGTLWDGGTSAAWGINSNAQVVGDSYNAAGNVCHAFLWTPGGTDGVPGNPQMKDLGTLTGVNSYARDVNSAGQVAGYSDIIGGGSRGFLYTGGVLQDLGTLGGPSSGARGINSAGEVVGWAHRIAGDLHAFRYSGGNMQDLGTLGAGSDATSINSIGQVVGHSGIPGVGPHAFLYSGGNMTDLGTFGGSGSYASRISSGGQVVGDASFAGDAVAHAFLYSGGPLQDLGTLGGVSSAADGVNSLGQVVGWANPLAGGSRAFLYDGHSMIDLNDRIAPGSGWLLAEARAINDSGQIVGGGYYGAAAHAFLLTPTPEPSTLVLLGVGAISFLFYAWRRRKRAA